MVVKLRSAVGVAMIWLAAVAGAAVTATVAIDRAGRDVAGVDVSSLRPATVGTPVATTTAGSPGSPTVRPPEPSASNASPSPTPTSTVSLTTPRSRTASVAGGQVTVACTGATILLRIAQPDNGWRVEVDQSGPAEVEVSFRRGDADARVRTDVTAVCAAGTPAFTVEDKS